MAVGSQGPAAINIYQQMAQDGCPEQYSGRHPEPIMGDQL